MQKSDQMCKGEQVLPTKPKNVILAIAKNGEGKILSMKKTKKTVKRDIYKPDRAENIKKSEASSKRLSRSKCSDTAVVYCNQWECFTRFLCRDEDSDSDQ
jgi:hypothetical protein